ncbi:hypothetical protein VTK73DRAFT_5443 [Phialemonium thermophilum]|uniref:Uncharacterized protein n=1 Tax=Phialemonium thermophilum TaxID=223376 RepID=A0ABR3V280_9PEZI
MRLSVVQAVFGSAALLLSVPPAAGSYSHRHAHLHDLQHHARRHIHAHHPASSDERAHADAHASAPLGRRATCSLPNDPDLVPVPGASNNGFAMSPDQSCTSGSYCPFACRPGKVMAQWQPGSTYVYPQSMNGGLFCDGGTPKKPFPDKPYCVDGTGTVSAVNRCGDTVAFCQTVLPGNEAMLIPTEVTGTSVLAVPGPSYWDGTAAQ